jgi:hypothetical protein
MNKLEGFSIKFIIVLDLSSNIDAVYILFMLIDSWVV